MSLYDQLNSAYTTQLQENNSFIEQNLNFAEQIVNALISFLDVPRETPDFKGVESYLQYLRLDQEKGYLAQETLAQALSHFPEGKFQCGLGLLLTAQPDHHPRQFATFSIDGDRDGDRLTVNVLGKAFEFEAATQSDLDLKALCAHVFDDLMTGLSWRISDEVEKTRIGFDVTPIDD
jgi:hypothetical protein